MGESFYRDLARHGERIALISDDGTTLTYAALDARVETQRIALGSQRRLVLLEARSAIDTIVTLLAALRGGHVVALCAPDRPDVARALLDRLPVGVHARWQGATLSIEDLGAHAPLHDELAILLSTSGSTGAAKWVRLSHRNLDANAASIGEYLGITAQDRATTTLPLHYSFGLSVLTTHLRAGASVWVTELSVADDTFWTTFRALDCTTFSGVPHTFEILRKRQFTGRDLPALRCVTQAGGRLAPESVRWMHALSRDASFTFYVMYGQTEATARMSYVPPALLGTHPDSIGVAIPGGAFSLIDEHGAPVADNHVTAELVYRGPNVMMGYAERAEDLTRGHELEELHTGDLAQRDAQGLYYVVGRKHRFLKLFGLRIALDEVEAHVRARGHDALAMGDDNVLQVLVRREVQGDTGAEVNAWVDALAQWLQLPRSAVHVQLTAQLPRLPSGKPDYVTAKAWMHASTHEAEHVRVRDILQRHLGHTAVEDGDTFVSLGGDSMSYVQVSEALEHALGSLPREWIHMPVAALEALRAAVDATVAPSPVTTAPMDTTILVRALSIVLVVAGHFGVAHYGGGTGLLLFAIAGWNFHRFQLPAMTRADSALPTLRLALRVALPSVAYLLLIQHVFGDVHWPAAFLFGNWFGPHITFGYWFIDLYVQTLLLWWVAASVRPVRRVLGAVDFTRALQLYLAACVLAALLSRVYPTEHLFNRVPHACMQYFIAGWCLSTAHTWKQRLWLSGALMLLWPLWCPPLTMAGLLFATWLPTVPMLRWGRIALSAIAGASLVIYLTHYQLRTVAKRLLGAQTPALMHVLFAVLGGVIIWQLAERTLRAGRDAWGSRRR